MPTSYSNPQGSGDRRAIIQPSDNFLAAGAGSETFYQAPYTVDGSVSTGVFWPAYSTAGLYTVFDFFEAVLIDEVRFYQDNSSTHGTWKWQGSNNYNDWTDVGSSFTLGGSTVQTITTLSGNVTSYRCYRMLGVSGVISGFSIIYQFEFKIDAPSIVSSVPNYFNPQGIGDRSGTISGSSLGDAFRPTDGGTQWCTNGKRVLTGVFDYDWGGSTTTVSVANCFAQFDLGAAKLVSEVTVWQAGHPASQGYWTMQGSNDLAAWAFLGDPFLLCSGTSQATIIPIGNTQAYRYYVFVGSHGASNYPPFPLPPPIIIEIDFKIADIGTPPNISSFLATPFTVAPGGSSTISWNVTGASSISISGLGSVSASGSTVVSPSSSTTYVLTAIASGTSSTKTVFVQVYNDPGSNSPAGPTGPPGPGSSAVGSKLVCAINTWSFSRWWRTNRLGPNLWSRPVKIFDNSIQGEEFTGGVISSGSESAADHSLGLLTETSDGGAAFLGDGLPTLPKEITCSTIPFDEESRIRLIDYWDMSQGAWKIDGAFWVLAGVGFAQTAFGPFTANSVTSRLAMLRSDDLGTTWVEYDEPNCPQKTGTSGIEVNLRKDLNSNFVDVSYKDIDSGILKLNSFDFSSGTWSGPYGSIYLGPGYTLAATGLNGIARFSNGDIGILYSPWSRSSTFYRLYTSSTLSWGPQVSVRVSSGKRTVDTSPEFGHYANLVVDPSGEVLHVFFYMKTLGAGYAVVNHQGDVIGDVFIFPGAAFGSDGIGRCVAAGGYLFVPLDDYADGFNAVWNTQIGYGTFVKELLPRDDIESGIPSCTYLVFMAPDRLNPPQFLKRHMQVGN